MAMTIDDKLGLNKFDVDAEPHIKVNEECTDQKLLERIVLACPAKLYSLDTGKFRISYEGCLECGTCRVLSQGKALNSWNHPHGGCGVLYKQG